MTNEIGMTEKDYKHYQKIAARVGAIIDKYEFVLLADYIREFNKGRSKRQRVAFSTAAQACREGRLPAISIGSRGNWLVPRGAIDAARDAGMLTGKRGRPDQPIKINGTCPICGRVVKGTSKKMTVKHFGLDGKTDCEGRGLPLINPRPVE